MQNKRGMSAVVTTLIIILLAIVAIGIVWVVVKNILDKGKEEITLTGLTLDLDITRATIEGTTLSVTVKRNPGEGNLIGINFVISDGYNSVVITEYTDLAELGVQTFTFNTNTQLPGIGDITSISVAPIFETSSGKEVTGDILDTTTYDPGDLGTGGGGDNGNGCTPNCAGLDCGDDGCGGSCGDCYEEGYSCADNQSCVDDDCIDEDPLVTCDGAECGTFFNNCGADVICGDCTLDYGEGFLCDLLLYTCYEEATCDPLIPVEACVAPIECGEVSDGCGGTIDCDLELGGCASGWECVGNLCEEIIYLHSGTVAWFGPPDVTRYFSSASLPPPDETDYDSHFVTFPNLAIPDCYYILNYNYDFSIYEYVIIELLLDEPLSINFDDPYEIWESISDCSGSL